MADLPGSDSDIMRDVYMTNTQRAAYERILAASLPVSGADDGLRESMTNLATALDEWIPKDAIGPLWGVGAVFAYRDTAQAIRKILASPSGPVLAASPSGVGGDT